jgi:hypothetical protein
VKDLSSSPSTTKKVNVFPKVSNNKYWMSSSQKQSSTLHTFMLDDLVYTRRFIQVDYEISINIYWNIKGCFRGIKSWYEFLHIK